MLKKTILLSILFSTAAQAKFIHPMDFDGSDAQKQEVIEYIKDNVKKDYCNSGIDMCSYSTILMMYEENNKADKEELTW